MFKKCILTISILLAITFSMPLGLSISTELKQDHGNKNNGCMDCGHYICNGNCKKCVECLAREKAKKCEKCGHIVCPSNCDKCVDCLKERIKELEEELQNRNA